MARGYSTASPYRRYIGFTGTRGDIHPMKNQPENLYKAITIALLVLCLVVVAMVFLIPRDGLDIGAVYGGF